MVELSMTSAFRQDLLVNHIILGNKTIRSISQGAILSHSAYGLLYRLYSVTAVAPCPIPNISHFLSHMA